MNDALEFNKIKKVLSENCQSFPGRERAQRLSPLNALAEIEERLSLSREFLYFLRNFGVFNFENVTMLSSLFAERYEVFSFEELQLIYYAIKAANAVFISIDGLEDGEKKYYRHILRATAKLIPLNYLEKRFEEIFSPDGEVNDNASPELRRIRHKKIGLRQNIMAKLQLKLNDPGLEKLVQEKLITQRDERFVIPFKEGAQSFVAGIVHAKSQSKASVYLEPSDIVPLNNELAGLNEEEKEEIYRILKEYSKSLRDNANAIDTNVEIIGLLDFYQGVSLFSRKIGAVPCQISPEPYLCLQEARHPLLILKSDSKVIPFNLELGEDFRFLIISGPNTGGKTVTLKAVGLLTLMALSGLPIPAKEESVVGIFEHVFADIGDSQSIESSLSTFSSHLNNIKYMLENGAEKTLVLLDEIGSATDPEQGSALAQAIVENLVEKQVFGIVTTHYTSLKIFAESNFACCNAAMQFDPDKHSPTYQFKLGLPGNSFALEVAKNLGLPTALIERASVLAGNQSTELTDLLQKMARQKKEMAQINYQNALKTRLLEQKANEYEQKIKELETLQKEQKKKVIQETREYLISLQKELNRELDEVKKSDKFSKRDKIKQTSNKIIELSANVTEAEKELTQVDLEKITDFILGAEVYLRDFAAQGVIHGIYQDTIKVEVNGFFYTTSKDNAYRPQSKKKIVKEIRQKEQQAAKSVKIELKILGLTFDEAEPLIEEFLDDALLNGLNKIRIVHGKGTGALRGKVRQYLKKRKDVAEFYSPAPEAGGSGVTVVSFGD